MGKFLQCSSFLRRRRRRRRSNKTQQEYSDQNSNLHHSDSSSNSSISSQPSLPSVPSLTPPLDHPTARHHCSATLTGHSSYVFSLALSGKHLFSGASDGQILVWQTSHNNNQTISEKCSSAVKSIAVLPGDKIFTAHQDHKIRVWRINDDPTKPDPRFKLITTLPTLNDRCMRFFSPKNHVNVRRHKKSTWVHHNDAVSALALSKDGSLLYSVSWDRTMKVWRTCDFKCLESIQNAHDDAINAVVLSHDRFVYTGSADRKIKVWKKEQGQKGHLLISTLEKHKSAVNALALSTDGSVLYSGACDRSIVVWEKDGGAAHMVVAGALRGHSKAILCLAVVGDLLCSGSADKTVRVWRRGCGNSYSCLAVLEGHGKPVKCLAGGLDGGSGDSENGSGNSYVVCSGGLDFDVKVWKIWVPKKKKKK